MKSYQCEYPDCTTMCNIRTTIKNKDSEFYRLRVCYFHANQLRPKSISDKTRRTQNARKEQRKDYPAFYQKHIQIAQGKNCEECGKKLVGNSTEIAHIIMKSTNNELATLDENILYLCGDICHNRFDSSLQKRKEMKCFNKSLERYKLFRNNIIKHSSETLFYENLLD